MAFTPQAPLDPLNPPEPDSFCDVVFRGGVVDGVVYPGFVTEVARAFKFQSLGGTSVGAVAAALTAASELRRRTGSDAGFNEVMRPLTEKLAAPSKANPKQTMLRALFHPERGTERFFSLAVAFFAPAKKGEGASQKIQRMLWTFYKDWISIGAITGLVLGSFSSALAVLVQAARQNQTKSLPPDFLATLLLGLFWPGLIFSVLGAAVFLGLQIWKDVKQLKKASGFGFCSGLSKPGSLDQGFTEWLHEGIQAASGFPLDRPLTFEDLWNAPGGPTPQLGTQLNSARTKSIDLLVMSTCVTHGRPYVFPQNDQSPQLFFRPKEWEHLFPAQVLNYLDQIAVKFPNTRQATVIRSSRRQVIQSGGVLKDVQTRAPLKPIEEFVNLRGVSPSDERYQDLLLLPIEKLPVIVAVRMSLSFPVLFKSVPCWAEDQEARLHKPDAAGSKGPHMRRLWFSDGGITSNFPIALFDKPLPSWPTFGVFLQPHNRETFPVSEDDPTVKSLKKGWRLTDFHSTGSNESWFLGDEDPDHAKFKNTKQGDGFFDFLINMANTSQSWSDQSQLRTAGIRDRVVSIITGQATQSGLNLELEGNTMLELAYNSGAQAGRAMVHKFRTNQLQQNPNLRGTLGWNDHRWIRCVTYLAALKTHLEGFAQAAAASPYHASLAKQISEATKVPPYRFKNHFEPLLDPNAPAQLHEILEAIEKLEKLLHENLSYLDLREQALPVLGTKSSL